jgi:hypothetical protein
MVVWWISMRRDIFAACRLVAFVHKDKLIATWKGKLLAGEMMTRLLILHVAMNWREIMI